MAETETIALADLPGDDPEFYACEEGDNFEALSPGLLAFGTTSRHVLASWLPAQFKKWGVRYTLVEGAATRGRPISAGYFDPNGLLVHHTGSTSSAAKPAPSLGTVTNGRTDLRGPLCQISTDFNGLTHIVAYGRANHAGQARATMGNPAGDGNAMYLGNEVQTSGTQKMPQAQYDALVLSSAAVLDYWGYTDARKLGLHHTTSLSGKWDLGAGTGAIAPYSITQLRADVTARLKAGPPGTNQEDIMNAAQEKVQNEILRVLNALRGEEADRYSGNFGIAQDRQTKLETLIAEDDVDVAALAEALSGKLPTGVDVDHDMLVSALREVILKGAEATS